MASEADAEDRTCSEKEETSSVAANKDSVIGIAIPEVPRDIKWDTRPLRERGADMVETAVEHNVKQVQERKAAVTAGLESINGIANPEVPKDIKWDTRPLRQRAGNA